MENSWNAINKLQIWISFAWCKYCVVTYSEGEEKFAITETKLYVPVVTLSTQDSAKFLQQLKHGFKRIVNWNKYESDIKTYAQNRYLNHLINPSFQSENRLFVLSFENEDQIKSHSVYYLTKVQKKDYNVMIDGRNLFDQPINSMDKTYEILRLYNWVFVRLFLFQRKLQNDCNRSK